MSLRRLSSSYGEGDQVWKVNSRSFFFVPNGGRLLKVPSISCRDQKPQKKVHVTGGEELYNDCSRLENMHALHPSFLVSLPVPPFLKRTHKSLMAFAFNDSKFILVT